MASRRPPSGYRRRGWRCDLCIHERSRWERLCGTCWRALPGNLRTAIVESHARGSKREWRAAKAAALTFLADAVARHMVTFQQRTATMLGERDA